MSSAQGLKNGAKIKKSCACRDAGHESCGQHSPFLLSSGHDDRDHRTRAERTKAKRLGRADHCSRRRRDLPVPARARQRHSGRLAVVCIDRLSAGVLDHDRRQGRHVCQHFCGDGRDPRNQRMACGASGSPSAGTNDRRWNVEAGGVHPAARSARDPARSTGPVRVRRARCGRARRADRRDRSRQLEHLPAVALSRALRRRRSALRQGHRLLSVRAARLYRDQELDAARDRRERAVRGNDLLGARRHRVRRSPPIDVADSDCARFGAGRSAVRGEGLVLWSRPLSPPLR